MKTATRSPDNAPWWTFGHVWLVVAGPLIVVVASFITLWMAIRTPDPVIAEVYYRRGIEINKSLDAEAKALLPATQGRNHAATPTRPADAAAGSR